MLSSLSIAFDILNVVPPGENAEWYISGQGERIEQFYKNL